MTFVFAFVPQILSVLIILTTCLYLYMKRALKYWQRKNVPYLPPTVPFGNLENPFISNKSLGLQYRTLYEKFKKMGLNFGGWFTFMSPVYVPVDPEFIKSVLTRDFNAFQARGFYSNERDQPLGATLFTVDGPKWRKMRTTVTPVFTSGKMKNMHQALVDCSTPMKESVAESVSQRRPIDIKHITACYTTDIIGNCAFGLDYNSFNDPELLLLNKVKYALDEGTSLLKSTFCITYQDLARKLRMVLFPETEMRYFANTIADAVEYRETNKVERNDFLQLLINTRNKQIDGVQVNNLTLDQIAAQSFSFFIAGFETSSSTMTFCLYELAQNQDVQQKARDEIKTVLSKHNGEVTYEAVNEMKYLQQVIDESLRKYPPVPILNRKSTLEYTIPNTDIVLDKDTLTVIPVLGLHYDPEFFPDPEKFDPDRFTEEEKSRRHQYTYLPFGDGPRNCIGLRFGLMQVKVGLSVLLKNFVFSLNPKTKVPMVFKSGFLLAAQDDILLDVNACCD